MPAVQMRSQRPGSKPAAHPPSSASSSISHLPGPPPTQNTAPVLEFACLYTHDVRRRGAKRWHDGRLRFHIFNRRAMLYDLPARNFLGDAHCAAGEPADGDELTLERAGVLVQIAELVARSETDLSEVTRKKTKMSPPAGTGGQEVSRGLVSAAPPKHRSLTSLLGTPRGPIGKAALPAKSPFEERRAGIENARWEDGRPPKRLRMDVTPSKVQTAAKRARRESATSNIRTELPQTSDFVDLLSDADDDDTPWLGLTSDLLEPMSSLQRQSPAVQKPTRPESPVSARSSSPGFQTMETPAQARKSRPSAVAAESRDRGQYPINIPGNVCRSLVSNDARSRLSDSRSEVGKTTGGEIAGTTDIPLGSTLRIAVAAPKKRVLMCQDQLLSKPSRPRSPAKDHAASLPAGHAVPTLAKTTPSRSERNQLEERLARLTKKQSPSLRFLPGNSNVADRGTKNVGRGGPGQVSPQKATTRPGMASDDFPAITDEMAEWFSLSQPLISPGPRPAANEARQLRRVVSEASKEPPPRKSPCRPKLAAGVAGAMHKDQGSGAKQSSIHAPNREQRKDHPARDMPPPKSRPSAKQTTRVGQRLDVVSENPPATTLQRPFKRPQPPRLKQAAADASVKAADPWSREAFDLFTWRPPGWNEEQWCPGNGTASLGAKGNRHLIFGEESEVNLTS